MMRPGSANLPTVCCAPPSPPPSVLRRVACAVVAAALTGCTASSVIPGPLVGDCADRPDGDYTFGTLGIGTCISGPTDAAFLVQDGETWLVVSNADPFRDFSGGSVLLLPADDLLSLSGSVDIATLDAHALPTEPYLGRIGLLPGNGVRPTRAIVAGRASEDSFTQTGDDRVWLLDLSDPRNPAFDAPRFLPVKADPYAVSVDPSTGLSFVVQSTDLSASIVDLGATPPRLVDPQEVPRVEVEGLTRAPGSDGVADLVLSLPNDPVLPVDQTWALTHVPDTARVWAPGPDGYTRFTRTEDDAWRPSALGVEVLPDDLAVDAVDDPLLASLSTDDGSVLTMLFSDGASIRRIRTDGSAGAWFLEPGVVLSAGTGDTARLSAPSLVDAGLVSRLYVDARPEGSEDAVIVSATTADGQTWTLRQGIAVEPPSGFSAAAQPMVLRDPHTDALRMWLSLYDGTTWSVAHAWSTDDGRTWTEPDVVLTEAGVDLGGVHVVATAGEYRLWASRGDDAGWSLVTATSADGLSWTAPEIALDLDLPPGGDRPPRAAIQPAGAGAWRVSSDRGGVDDELAVPGTEWPASLSSPGFRLYVASGHLIGPDLSRDADGGVLPGSLLDVAGLPTLYATVVGDDGRARLAALREVADRWGIASDDLIPAGGGGNVAGASSPAVASTGTGFAMAYAAEDANSSRRIRLATSPDGRSWKPSGGAILGDLGGWANVRREPGTLLVDGDVWTLWFAGFDGSRWRIGTARSDDAGQTWALVPGLTDAWALGTGEAGAFDDSGVRHPTVVVDGDAVTVYYAGFDGTTWRIGRATRASATAAWGRATSPVSGGTIPILREVTGTFSELGVRSPVAGVIDGRDVLLYAGTDGRSWRTGSALRTVDGVFPAHRVPRPGDTLTLRTWRGDRGRSQIDLAQNVEGFSLPGVSGRPARDGPTAAVLDATRGFLFVATKDLSGLIVVDVRDDSTPDDPDANAFDLEAVIRIDSVTGNTGIQDLTLGANGLLYATLREPEGVIVIDTSTLVDNDVPEVIDRLARATLPMHDRTDDMGEETFASIGGAGVARVPGEELLLATHFRDNSVSIFDLRAGAWGEEIRYLRNIAENPHLVRVAPSGDYAVVLGYLGDDAERHTSAMIVLIDLREDSPTYLEPFARIMNR